MIPSVSFGARGCIHILLSWCLLACLLLYPSCHAFVTAPSLALIRHYSQSITITSRTFSRLERGNDTPSLLLPSSLLRLVVLKSKSGPNQEEKDETNTSNTVINNHFYTQSLVAHHTAIKTRDIEMAIRFYSLFGFQVDTKFRSGPARCAWLVVPSLNDKNNDDGTSHMAVVPSSSLPSSRLEFIEVPPHLLKESKGTVQRAIDLTQHETLLGINHLALDVTTCIHQITRAKTIAQQPSVDETCMCPYGLSQFLDDVNRTSIKTFGKTLRIALPPRQQIIGTSVYEIAFVYDVDGALLELLHWTKYLEIRGGTTTDNMHSGWEPWDGKGFVGAAAAAGM